MKTEFDENVLDYWKIPNGNYIVKRKKDDGLDDECVIKYTIPAVLGAFILSNSKRIKNNFFRQKTGFTRTIYFTRIVIHYNLERNFGMYWISEFSWKRVVPT